MINDGSVPRNKSPGTSPQWWLQVLVLCLTIPHWYQNVGKRSYKMRTKTLPSSSSSQNPLFSGWAKSISKQTLANLILDREDIYSTTLRRCPNGSVMDFKASSSQNSTRRLCSFTQTIAFESLVVVSSKYGCYSAIWRVIPFTLHGPPETIFYFTSLLLHLISMKPFSISDISILPNSCHWPNRVALTYSQAGALPNSLAYKACWNRILALNLVSSSTWKTSVTLCFRFSRMAPSTGKDEITLVLEALVISAQEGTSGGSLGSSGQGTLDMCKTYFRLFNTRKQEPC